MRKLMVTMCCSLMLTACGQRVVVEKIKPPIEWLTCKDEPEPPLEATPANMVVYMMDLRAALFDCHDKLNRVKDFYEF